MNTKNHHQQLLNYLISAESTDELSVMLEALLTPNELQSMAMRLEIARLLKAGVTQREIAKQLGVGIATVTRGSREIKNGKFRI